MNNFDGSMGQKKFCNHPQQSQKVFVCDILRIIYKLAYYFFYVVRYACNKQKAFILNTKKGFLPESYT